MTVSELIEYLKTQPQDVIVTADKFSEQVLLEKEYLVVIEACYPRDDGWVHDKRPDKPSQRYLTVRP